MQNEPTLAVTLVANHDTQPLQALEAVVEAWFKPLAYALILQRAVGFPCVFFADYYGAIYEDQGRDGESHYIEMASHREIIDLLLKVRREYAYGHQEVYFDHPNAIGWLRSGGPQHPAGTAVVMSNGDAGMKRIRLPQTKRKFYDATGAVTESVLTEEDGWGNFTCAAGGVSVWLPVCLTATRTLKTHHAT